MKVCVKVKKSWNDSFMRLIFLLWEHVWFDKYFSVNFWWKYQARPFHSITTLEDLSASCKILSNAKEANSGHTGTNEFETAGNRRIKVLVGFDFRIIYSRFQNALKDIQSILILWNSIQPLDFKNEDLILSFPT